ncbi:hypothetical protein RIF29_28491 [Crotalaria pallida]|uniref:TRF2/HOY1 PH-like domain-containing protein n=1 Tax=Crotalaria pallida TaxID=3830 RepID=A0AAN9ED75_CROPI
MVQLMRSEAENHCLKKVKLETQDEFPPPLHSNHKRPRLDSPPKSGSSEDSFPVPPSLYNPLDEPSPLGLRLRKSPSLLDLIQMRLSQQDDDDDRRIALKKDHKGVKGSGATADSKLKASNFPATVLKIGTWEYKSRYEGDLVAKCYFAKHKLVWEVLDGCLKNKIEIPWSDIMALKANYPEDAPGTLEVVLSRRPLFFREINPQPRKHTLWQATSDFTGGQASIHRRHFMQCPQGLLGKHFEKLIQCDHRLNFLSQQSELVLDSLYFEPGSDQIESSAGFDRKSEERASLFGLHDVESGSAVQSTSSKSEHNIAGKALENVSQEITSRGSVMNNFHAVKDFRSRGAETLKFLNNLDQIKLPGLHPSMSMNDLVSHIGNCISEQCDNQYNRSILEEFTQSLFNDSQLTTASDEQYIMSRVNSLYCLLQKDPSTAAEDPTRIRNGNGNISLDAKEGGKVGITTHVSSSSSSKSKEVEVELECPHDDGSGCKKGGLSRKESVGELLINLPRIASLPQFLFHMAEDSVNHVR